MTENQYTTKDGVLYKDDKPYTGSYLGETFDKGKKLQQKKIRRRIGQSKGGYRRIPRNRG